MHSLPGTKIFDESQSLRQRCRLFKNLRMGDDTETAAQNQIRDRNSGRSPQSHLKPGFELAVAVRILPVGGHGDIDVQKDHGVSMIS